MITPAPILLTGKNGQIGFELGKLLSRMGKLIAVDREDVDLTKPSEIRRTIQELRPRLIVNAAAYTAVDKAETDQEAARAVNTDVPAILAEETKKLGAALVHFSTDYIFDGLKGSPYLEDDLANPMSVYGQTKLAGEEAVRQIGVPHLTFRTQRVYGIRGQNFLLTILRLATQREELRIVSDQIGAPTWCRELARATASILQELSLGSNLAISLSNVSGTYHMTAAGTTTWYEFACAILDEGARTAADVPWFAAVTSVRPLITHRIVPITTAQYPTPAKRPAYPVLSNEWLSRTFRLRLPNWQNQLHSAVSDV
jgi:dTDP-4-dehydrorhamnose reductase